MIQTLISNGHRLEDVLDYTMGQINVLLKSIYEIKNEEATSGMQYTRAAMWAEQKDFEKIINPPKAQGIPGVSN